MNVAKLFSPKHNSPVKVIDPRRNPRRAVRFSATVAAKNGLADGVVTNISETGCDLRLVTSSFLKRYLSLKLFSRDGLALTIYPYDGTPAFKITLAVIRWAKRKWVGVEFVKLSQEAREKLQQLCQQQVVLTVAG
ncbi:MAG TPA: PilZ domain-containing protein [Nitrospiraceae bacterium]|nr:PilZ domain-containing protein [Nitrospiraceae bacterium]